MPVAFMAIWPVVADGQVPCAVIVERDCWDLPDNPFTFCETTPCENNLCPNFSPKTKQSDAKKVDQLRLSTRQGSSSPS